MMNKNFIDEVIDSIISVTGSPKDQKIATHEPYFQNTNAITYVKECITSGWVSSAGKWVDKFEDLICEYTGAKYAVAVTNGTVALRLALFLVGVKHSEEVLIPPMTFIATANAVSHLGAIPHFIDIEKDFLGMSPHALEERLEEIAIKKNGKIYNKFSGRRIAAIVPVHIFGNPAKIIELKEIAQQWNIPLVEDAAEALGSWVKDGNHLKHCGSFGMASIISFNGNKIISTGGGGIIITNDKILASKAKHYSSTAKIKHPWAFIHDEIGWNDRLPNINAALGVSQMEVLKERLFLKRKLFNNYSKILNKVDGLEIMKKPVNCKSNHWLVSIRLTGAYKKEELKKLRDSILKMAHNNNLLLRPSWDLLNSLKIYNGVPSGDLKNAEDQSFRIINLPSSPQLLEHE